MTQKDQNPEWMLILLITYKNKSKQKSIRKNANAFDKTDNININVLRIVKLYGLS
ncbi:hypothetical protein IV55_GL001779 [Furfurilactobacillus siliginis]|uniref:Uncharacterized protein n=1 Tax=Furfurilactobacillus siliginis TaxID=348151 RepID=A0A0R2L1X5_9LACO|nr:hypothetical protein IV55_GL001779 [Furfurilactobacillus siliginis]